MHIESFLVGLCLGSYFSSSFSSACVTNVAAYARLMINKMRCYRSDVVVDIQWIIYIWCNRCWWMCTSNSHVSEVHMIAVLFILYVCSFATSFGLFCFSLLDFRAGCWNEMKIVNWIFMSNHNHWIDEWMNQKEYIQIQQIQSIRNEQVFEESATGSDRHLNFSDIAIKIAVQSLMITSF